MNPERRHHRRTRSFQSGKIVFRDGHCAVDCVVIDISAGGAQLRLADWIGVPDRFELRLRYGPRYLASVCHRAMDRAGVRFVSPDAP